MVVDDGVVAVVAVDAGEVVGWVPCIGQGRDVEDWYMEVKLGLLLANEDQYQIASERDMLQIQMVAPCRGFRCRRCEMTDSVRLI